MLKPVSKQGWQYGDVVAVGVELELDSQRRVLAHQQVFRRGYSATDGANSGQGDSGRLPASGTNEDARFQVVVGLGVSRLQIQGPWMSPAGDQVARESARPGEQRIAYKIWDRVFKTFLDKTTGEVGTGPTEPTMWGKFLMPFKEPEDTAIAPGSTR